MEDKDSKRNISHEDMVKIKNKFEEIVNSNSTDPDEDSTAPVATESKPKPTVEQVIEILNSIKDNEFEEYEEVVTDLAEIFDDGKCWIWMSICTTPTKVQIFTSQTSDIRVEGNVVNRVVVEGVENVAKLIVALHVDIENIDDLMYNLFEALANKIPGEWDEDYYNPGDIIEKLRKRYDIEYEVCPKPYIPKPKKQ